MNIKILPFLTVFTLTLGNLLAGHPAQLKCDAIQVSDTFVSADLLIFKVTGQLMQADVKVKNAQDFKVDYHPIQVKDAVITVSRNAHLHNETQWKKMTELLTVKHKHLISLYINNPTITYRSTGEISQIETNHFPISAPQLTRRIEPTSIVNSAQPPLVVTAPSVKYFHQGKEHALSSAKPNSKEWMKDYVRQNLIHLIDSTAFPRHDLATVKKTEQEISNSNHFELTLPYPSQIGMPTEQGTEYIFIKSAKYSPTFAEAIATTSDGKKVAFAMASGPLNATFEKNFNRWNTQPIVLPLENPAPNLPAPRENAVISSFTVSEMFRTLNLTKEQNEKLRNIIKKDDKQNNRAQQIRAMLTAEQQKQFEIIVTKGDE